MELERYAELKKKKLISLRTTESSDRILVTVKHFDSATGEPRPDQSAVLSVADLRAKKKVIENELATATALLRDCEKLCPTRKN
ncbi:MAG: hypothetical protein QME66_04720 [Candidatus Eisenbacteria bacterium]|nr:hypothetical protein [Candidatus Eisenbacteria bacterium]